jgi:hypothetical protein
VIQVRFKIGMVLRGPKAEEYLEAVASEYTDARNSGELDALFDGDSMRWLNEKQSLVPSEEILNFLSARGFDLP